MYDSSLNKCPFHQGNSFLRKAILQVYFQDLTASFIPLQKLYWIYWLRFIQVIKISLGPIKPNYCNFKKTPQKLNTQSLIVLFGISIAKVSNDAVLRLFINYLNQTELYASKTHYRYLQGLDQYE
tara:strand:+ start:20016 stop:20390 length:375 start_codon:yes stop_codon:yes gene_type:complete